MANQTRILICHYLPNAVSGAERSIADMVECFDPVYKVTMLTPGEGNLSEYYRQRGFDVWSKKIHTPRRLFPGFHNFQSQDMSQELTTRGFNIVLGNTFSAASRIRTAARLAGIPFGLYVREYIKDKETHRKVLDQTDKIFTISQDMKDHLDQMTDPGKVILIYNYINPGPIDETVSRHKQKGTRILPFPIDVPVVGLVGRITRFKQQHLFIQSIPRILVEVPNARFVIVGDTDEKDYERELHELTYELGVQDKVIFMGHRMDTIELTSELSISCLTSTREPLGRVILEAHLVGCPVVASNIGGPAEIITDEVTGLLFPPLDKYAAFHLSNQITRLLTQPDLKNRLVSNASIHIRSTFASLRSVRLLEKNIEHLIKGEEFVLET